MKKANYILEKIGSGYTVKTLQGNCEKRLPLLSKKNAIAYIAAQYQMMPKDFLKNYYIAEET